MRIGHKTKMVEQITSVYIADDGTEFETRDACMKYESKRNNELLEKINRCPEANDYAPFDGEENMEYKYYRWYFPTSVDDIAVLNKVYEVDLNERDIGQWICIEYHESAGSYIHYLSSAVKYAAELLEKLGYKMFVTEKEEVNESI